jgi:hypothetical protein
MADILELLAKRKALEAQTDAAATGKPIPPALLAAPPLPPPPPREESGLPGERMKAYGYDAFGVPMFNQSPVLVQDTPLYIKRDDHGPVPPPPDWGKPPAAPTKAENIQNELKSKEILQNDKVADLKEGFSKFKAPEKPDLSDLKDDLNASDDYDNWDLLKLALIGTMPGIVGGLFGGLAGAAGAAPGGVKGVEMAIQGKKDKAKQRRENAKDEAKRRMDTWKEDNDQAYRDRDLLYKQLQTEMSLTGKISEASARFAAQMLGMEGKERLIDAQVGAIQAKVEAAKELAAVEKDKKLAELELAVKKGELTQQQFEQKLAQNEQLHQQRLEEFEKMAKAKFDEFTKMSGAKIEAQKATTEAQVGAITKKGNAAAAATAKKAGAAGKGGKGQGQGKTMPVGTVREMATATYAMSQLEEVRDLVKKNGEKFGPIYGRARNMGAKVFGDTFDATKEASQINAVLGQKAQEIGRYLEGGKLAEGDINRYLKLLPDLDDDPDTIEVKIQNLQNAIAKKHQAEIEAAKGAGYNVGSIPVPDAPGAAQIGGGGHKPKFAPPSPKDLQALEWVNNPKNKSHKNYQRNVDALKKKGLM